jgi:hypothetical protein
VQRDARTVASLPLNSQCNRQNSGVSVVTRVASCWRRTFPDSELTTAGVECAEKLGIGESCRLPNRNGIVGCNGSAEKGGRSLGGQSLRTVGIGAACTSSWRRTRSAMSNGGERISLKARRWTCLAAKVTAIGAGLLLVCFVTWSVVRQIPQTTVRRDYTIRHLKTIAASVEQYQKRYGRLPASIEQVGIRGTSFQLHPLSNRASFLVVATHLFNAPDGRRYRLAVDSTFQVREIADDDCR